MVPQKIVYLGTDHAGFEAKDNVKNYLEEKGLKVISLGCFSEDPCDHPDISREVGEKVKENPDSFGVLICGSGVGVSIGANKMRGVRAVNGTSVPIVESGRSHNDTNVLCLGARLMTFDEMKPVIDCFFETEFQADVERYARRVKKMNEL